MGRTPLLWLLLFACHSGGNAAKDAGFDASAGAARWTNIGITSTREVATATQVLDHGFSGRVNVIRPVAGTDTAYLGTSGGGIWRTANLSAAAPDWQPIGDGLSSLSISALDLDPQQPATLYAAIGDLDGFFITVHGRFVKSTDGGATWSAPQLVTDGAATASIVYDLRVDPMHPGTLFVATDQGLFRSTDAGATFHQLALTNAGATQVAKAIHTITYVGEANGNTRWVVSGVTACDVGQAPPTFVGSPVTAGCPVGNLGDLWRSRDNGDTWTSIRATVGFPGSAITTDGATGVGRMMIATNATAMSDPSTSVVFALAMAIDAHQSIDVLRSLDGGQTWTSAKGTLANPAGACVDVGVAERRTGAIAVEPGNGNHVLIGGTDCAQRTTSALAAAPAWSNVENVSAPCGALGFVHEDWRDATIVGARAYAANDGGIYVASGLFTAAAGDECAIAWTDLNRGLSTDEAFTLASGDPSDGNGDVMLTGCQDLGTLWRDHDPVWDHVVGGDGSGTALSGSVGWAVVNGTPEWCDAAAADCGVRASWKAATLPVARCGSGDCVSLVSVRFAPIGDGRVLSISSENVWLSDASHAWTRATPVNLPAPTTNVIASPQQAGLFGVTLSDGATAVTSDGLGAAPTWTLGSRIPIGSASALAFPPSPPAGSAPGDVYVAASDAPVSGAHVFVTRDRGMTWQPIAGAGLPELPIHAVRYDPAGARLYVATDRGVYVTTDDGATWALAAPGLPNVPVTDLFVSRDGTLLRASTLGRGIWQLTYPPGSRT